MGPCFSDSDFDLAAYQIDTDTESLPALTAWMTIFHFLTLLTILFIPIFTIVRLCKKKY